ncbi:uncharacterized protein K460DRAFT_416070 [Cucurbitaria berberidis CBS 394.84]|uniref:Uncharacterized protein n=1 Tax=Cucurbitaria berberidis CBS 394.84 TaxID=1168544 RepID=A0A9P4L752_9PLEO|nr:uncharacterized protein K460DRAFT_416070 [Cucurbitaria berberidis CBS 394.84]KAF1844686.1 hypothetical protein K460DRAFT_416070 [Cucurbitaria berberidis CBS 394.84]
MEQKRRRGGMNQICEVNSNEPADQKVIAFDGHASDAVLIGFANPLRNFNESAKDDTEVVPSNIPTDANVGQSHTIKDLITTALAGRPTGHSSNQDGLGVKRSASNELLKIDDLDDYADACSEYGRGLREGWNREFLLHRVEEWQKLEK